jgi:hypothetical protein
MRPLSRIASQAEALGRAVRGGRTLEPLATNGLPREIVDVVAAINAMLHRLETTLHRQKHNEAIFTRFWRADPVRGGGAEIGLALSNASSNCMAAASASKIALAAAHVLAFGSAYS